MNHYPCNPAYIRMLEAETAQYIRDREAQTIEHDPGSRLRIQVARWVQSLPAELRQRPYTMDMLLREFDASPRALGKALSELGAVRFRDWRGAGPYPRLWRLPQD